MPESPELLYATGNPGKLEEVRAFLGGMMPIESPKDRGLNVEVEETGATLEENALLKARAYRAVAPAGMIMMADDTGLEIDALSGEPGVKVRRWRDGRTEMTDEQIIEHCLRRLQGVPGGKRGAQFRTVIVLALPDGTEELFDGTLRGEIAEQSAPVRVPGFPFRSLFVTETGKLLGELEEKPDSSVLTHRQAAVQKAVDWLRDYNK
ncbi:MAG: non-canonical purine NTP pyrophosphatase [Patescibacteria group bacterium]